LSDIENLALTSNEIKKANKERNCKSVYLVCLFVLNTPLGLSLMSLDPYKKRELVLLLLFSFDMGQDLLSSDIIDLVKDECRVSKKYVLEALGRAHTVFKAKEQCDGIISQICQDYKISRIQSVERNVLRLAIFEVLFEKEVPLKVVFSEAKRLAKKFSTDEAASFVHALLAAASTHSGICVEEEVPDLQDAYKAMCDVPGTEG
jgi:N utilization substance protein B